MLLEMLLTGCQSWYLLGPVTRFKIVGEKVDYEVAQVPILAFRNSGDTLFPGPDDMQVIRADTVCTLLKP